MDKKTNFKASEQDILATVNDFEIFCRYIDEKRPMLSKRNEVLGKNNLFELNKLLTNRKDVTVPNYQQESYPIIDLMFNLAIFGKLYLKTGDLKGNVYFESTERKTEFDALNNFEKYCFLLVTFWIEYDFKEIIRWGNNPVREIVETIATSKPSQKLIKGAFSKRRDHDPVFSYNSVIVQYFSYFGFCTYIPFIFEPKKFSKYEDNIKEIFPTEFGVNICGILAEQKLPEWNIPWLEMYGIYEDEDDEENDSEAVPLFSYFVPIFPDGLLTNTIKAETKKILTGNYTFKVSLEKTIWRKIRLCSNHSLEDLHLAIQEAFDFDNDHLYSFFMDNKRYSRNAFNSSNCDDGPYADDAIIGELGLHTGQKILYFFDYGDSWEFAVQLLEINEDVVPSENPEIIEIKGEAPEQYGSFGDFDFD